MNRLIVDQKHGLYNRQFYLFRWGTKLAIVSGATVLVVNHEVFGANKYTKQIIGEVRKSLPDTAEAFDQMPTKEELNDAIVNSWNSGMNYYLNWSLA